MKESCEECRDVGEREGVLASNASEASNELRRSPNSRKEVFGHFPIDQKSATRI